MLYLKKFMIIMLDIETSLYYCIQTIACVAYINVLDYSVWCPIALGVHSTVN